MVDVSVIIPVYNPGVLIKRCLDSILAQEGGYTFEVLLVDDGSTDDSSKIIESYQNSDFRLFHQKNAGPACARNKGISEAKGKYIAFIDADDFWCPTFFERMIGFLDTYQECIAVSSAQKHLTVSGDNVSPACLDNYKEPFIIEDFFKTNSRWDFVCTGSMMVRSEIVKSIGGQRSDLRITEDLEFWALLATMGKWGFVPDILFTSDGTDTISNQEIWLKKMTVRWANAPQIEQWQRRILENQPALADSISFKVARGAVSRNLTYCQLLSGRTEIARQEAKQYGTYFIHDGIGMLMNICKYSSFTWIFLCRVLQYRESHRFSSID